MILEKKENSQNYLKKIKIALSFINDYKERKYFSCVNYDTYYHKRLHYVKRMVIDYTAKIRKRKKQLTKFARNIPTIPLSLITS